MICIDTKNPQYQMLKDTSGIREDTLKTYCEYYQETQGRWPNLDELPKANSRPYIENKYDIKNSMVKSNKLSEELMTDDSRLQGLLLSKVYKDKLISITPLDDEVSHIDIISRPTLEFSEQFFPKDYDNIELNVINGMLEDLAKYSGLQFKTITTDEANKILDVPNASISKAFVKDGKVFVNTDLMTADSYIHEMLHIFIGSTKFASPKLYEDLLRRTINTFDFQNMRRNFKDRSELDTAEEVLVTEFSKYLTGQESIFDNISNKEKSLFMYDIKRALDVGIFGDVSVKALTDADLFGSKLVDVAQSVNSDLVRNNFIDVWKYSKYNRKLANMKEDLLRRGIIQEEC